MEHPPGLHVIGGVAAAEGVCEVAVLDPKNVAHLDFRRAGTRQFALYPQPTGFVFAEKDEVAVLPRLLARTWTTAV